MSLLSSCACILTVYHKVYIQIPTPSLSFLSLLFWPDIQAIIIKGQHSLLSQPLSRDLVQLKHEICGHSFGHAVCGQLGALQVSILYIRTSHGALETTGSVTIVLVTLFVGSLEIHRSAHTL